MKDAIQRAMQLMEIARSEMNTDDPSRSPAERMDLAGRALADASQICMDAAAEVRQ